MSSKLTPLQQKVFDLLDKKPNTDVPLKELYDAAYPDSVPQLFEHWENRDMQQKMGPLFARINQKLKNGKVEPGVARRTYRLTIKKD